MKKHIVLTLLLLVALVLPSHAVLKEKDLDNSLAVLRHELTTYHREQQDRLFGSKKYTQRVMGILGDIMRKSSQNSLMLYSQKTDYVFDLTYACHEATQQYQEFQKQIAPFREFIDRSQSDIARYDSLIDVLSKMPVSTLSDQAKTDRNVCLTLAINLRRMLKDSSEELQENRHWYELTEQRLKSLNDYANKRYAEIQTNIFRNGGDNYFKTLSQMNWKVLEARMAIADKYTPSNTVKSQWDVKWILGLFTILIIYGFISIILNFVLLRFLMGWLLRRAKTSKHLNVSSWYDKYMAKRTCINLTTSVITLALILGIIRITSDQNFLMMASNLLIEYAWLLAVILISLLLRVDATQIKSAFRIYSPLIVVGFIVIAFRIVLIPNDIVDVALPPILLLCSLWQWRVVRKYNRQIPRYDVYLTYTSLVVFCISVVSAWLGYTLLSVQLLIWWIMQMTCLLTLACIRDWMNDYRKRRAINDQPITRTWFFRMLYYVMLPTLIVYSFLVSVYWAADVFNLSALTWDVFRNYFINTEYIRISIFSISQVIILFFMFRYINHSAKALVKQYLQKKDPATAESRAVMFINVIQVVVWGLWFIFSLAILHVSNTWLVVISGGLSTGVGFAMKDILENIYYGISLMAGRIKVGDWIECDGTKGKVSSISYTSTMINAIDGSVIAFTNSQLFTKNYKNLTKNHGYILAMIPFGVAYGSNMRQVISLIEEAINKKLRHQYIDKKKPAKVVFTEFGDSSVNFKVICWVDAIKQIYVVSDIMETIFQTLQDNNIDIPFPQRDVHIIRS